MRTFINFLFGNPFRAVVAAIVAAYSFLHYPYDRDITALLVVIVVAMYAVGLVYGYVAQTLFMAGKTTAGQRIVSLFAWVATLAMITMSALGLWMSGESNLHPTSIANMKVLMVSIFWTLSHAMLGVIWNIVSTKTIANQVPRPRIESGRLEKVRE